MTNPVYQLTLRSEHARALGEALFERAGIESAAYVLCGVGASAECIRLLSHAVVPVDPSHYRLRTQDRMTIVSDSLVPVVKRARREGLALLFAHSHPNGPLAFSRQDDAEEAILFPALHGRAPGRPHGSLILTSPDDLVGRIRHPDGSSSPIDRITSVGERLRVLRGKATTAAPLFDRQVRAFGPVAQELLGALRVGVVGAGGTGSAVFEQLLRLGVGEILIIDDDSFDDTNVNRVYGSRVTDGGRRKVEIVARTAAETGLPGLVEVLEGSILDDHVARQLRTCDVIFGCTDRELPRLILGRLATRYLTPVIDTGVLVESSNRMIRSVIGRVTMLRAGTACLLCRGRISPEALRVESLGPAARQQLAAEGYAPELASPAPAVIPFTTATASYAITELLQLVTGFMGARETTETLVRFDSPNVRTNSEAPGQLCDCANEASWGRGDEEPFLGLTWRPGTP